MNLQEMLKKPNGELVEMLRETFNWGLMKQIYKVLEERGVSLSDIYYGTYDFDAIE